VIHFYINGWLRYCPECTNQILHTGLYSKYTAKRQDKYKRLCNSCSQSGSNHPNFGKSSGMKGKIPWNKGKRGIQVAWNKGKMGWIKMSDISKLKMSKSHEGINNIMFNKKHSIITRKKMSLIRKSAWKMGKYKRIWKSKGQIEISNILKSMGHFVINEFLIKGKPYDIFIKNKNLIIEFNGTYWHCDPRKYEGNYYHKQQKMMAKELWVRDKEKIELSNNSGYTTKIIWQIDWESCKNKREYLINYIKS